MSEVRRCAALYVRHVTVERGLAANTVAAYRRDLERYLSYLEDAGVSDPRDIQAEHVVDFLQRAGDDGESLAATSTGRRLSTVRGYHRYLHEEKLSDHNPADHIRPPQAPQKLPQAISVDEMARLLDTPPRDTTQGIRDRALLELLYATGARISEAVALNVDDVRGGETETGHTLRLLGKGNKQRLVPLGSFARAALDDYLVRARPLYSARGASTPALFLGARGHRLSRQNAWLIIRARAEQAGLHQEISPHTFRHSFATHLLSGGADVRVVQELLGHSSVATTQIYTLVTADALRDMYTTAHPRARRPQP